VVNQLERSCEVDLISTIALTIEHPHYRAYLDPAFARRNVIAVYEDERCVARLKRPLDSRYNVVAIAVDKAQLDATRGSDLACAFEVSYVEASVLSGRDAEGCKVDPRALDHGERLGVAG